MNMAGVSGILIKSRCCCMCFLKKAVFAVLFLSNDKGAQEVDSIFGELLPEIQASWLNRYACGADGGWLNRSVISDEELPD